MLNRKEYYRIEKLTNFVSSFISLKIRQFRVPFSLYFKANLLFVFVTNIIPNHNHYNFLKFDWCINCIMKHLKVHSASSTNHIIHHNNHSNNHWPFQTGDFPKWMNFFRYLVLKSLLQKEKCFFFSRKL